MTPLDWHRAVSAHADVVVARVRAQDNYVHVQITDPAGSGREGQVNYYQTPDGDRTYVFFAHRRHGAWVEQSESPTDTERPPGERFTALAAMVAGTCEPAALVSMYIRFDR